MVDNTNSLKTKTAGTESNYVANQRYLIELTEKNSGRVYCTKRMRKLAQAVDVAAEYNLLMGISAEIIDSKTGEYL